MEPNNAYEQKLAAYCKGGMPARTEEACNHVIDTLDLCWAGARAVFGDQARPEHAIAVLGAVDAWLRSDSEPPRKRGA